MRKELLMNKETLRAIKFTLFSISAGIIQILSFTLLNELTSLPEHISYLIALVLSVLWNFTFNTNLQLKHLKIHCLPVMD